MKWFALALMIFASNALALNMQIGFPVPAARLSLTGETRFKLDCENKKIDILESSNFYFTRHVKKNVSVMCFKDKSKYDITMKFVKGGLEMNMLARQPGRYQPKDFIVE